MGITLNELNEILSALPENMYQATKPMYASVRAMHGVTDINSPYADDVVESHRATARELYAMKRAVAFLCKIGSGSALYVDAWAAGVIPLGDGSKHVPGQVILTEDKAPAKAVDWLLSFSTH